MSTPLLRKTPSALPMNQKSNFFFFPPRPLLVLIWLPGAFNSRHCGQIALRTMGNNERQSEQIRPRWSAQKWRPLEPPSLIAICAPITTRLGIRSCKIKRAATKRFVDTEASLFARDEAPRQEQKSVLRDSKLPYFFVGTVLLGAVSTNGCIFKYFQQLSDAPNKKRQRVHIIGADGHFESQASRAICSNLRPVRQKDARCIKRLQVSKESVSTFVAVMVTVGFWTWFQIKLWDG